MPYCFSGIKKERDRVQQRCLHWLLFSPHSIAMPKGLCFAAVVFFRRLIGLTLGFAMHLVVFYTCSSNKRRSYCRETRATLCYTQTFTKTKVVDNTASYFFANSLSSSVEKSTAQIPYRRFFVSIRHCGPRPRRRGGSGPPWRMDTKIHRNKKP